jgi:hypothetical protein
MTNSTPEPLAVKTFKQGGVEVSVWRNPGQNGVMYNTTIRNSYKDEKSGKWKETSSFSPTDLAVLSTAFAAFSLSDFPTIRRVLSSRSQLVIRHYKAVLAESDSSFHFPPHLLPIMPSRRTPLFPQIRPPSFATAGSLRTHRVVTPLTGVVYGERQVGEPGRWLSSNAVVFRSRSSWYACGGTASTASRSATSRR